MTGRTSPPTLSGLYVILDPTVRPERPLDEVLKDAVRGGARIVQYRNKAASMKQAYGEASALRTIAKAVGATFIVNDRCDLALAVDADGVHVGQDDLPYAEARAIMGPDKIVGLSTHSPAQVEAAARFRPDYIGYGPIFTPLSKTDHDPVVGIEGLRAVRSLITVPIFAIGGIRAEHVGEIIRAGANGVAVISAVLNASDIQTAVARFIGQMPGPASRGA
ncbi:Thiamine-phosphate synthase [Nitrospira sp. KM1]|uniref:thiamine phosphate synthase n=1 Tax=Nitrospira sp. KM1 TaxID=1936990 RepID=UPI0013A7B623|nr:thiamine phosphate synthase [Nitrospira sp. KM1]BCA53516.1 Thiamine-phosphate synthase [Nitrospira sp. KM1]